MGYRTRNAYDQEEREEWRRFLASQSPWQRARIRTRAAIPAALILIIVLSPFIAGMLAA